MTPEMAWYPLRVTYSREMKFKAYLDALGIENFIPLHYVQPEGSGAKRKLVPVVHNLIFVRAAQATVQSLKRTSPFADQIRYIMSLTERRPLTIPPKQMRDFIAVAGTYEEQLLYLPADEARLQAGDTDVQHVLLYVLTDILKLLHPFMPFITEEIYQAIPHSGEALIIEAYPEYDSSLSFPEDENDFEAVMEAIKAIRSRRAEMNVPPSKKASLIIVTDMAGAFTSGEAYLKKLAYAGDITVSSQVPETTDGMVTVVTQRARMYMPMSELVDIQKERERIEKELKKARGQLEAQEKKLSNEAFVSRAPEAVVAAEREKAEKAKALIENLTETLAALG